jgi:hypothetical protein
MGDAIEDDAEALVVLHTRQSLIPAIIERANREHPYDTPQVLAVPVIDANPAYRDWVLASTQDAEHAQTDPPSPAASRWVGGLIPVDDPRA